MDTGNILVAIVGKLNVSDATALQNGEVLIGLEGILSEAVILPGSPSGSETGDHIDSDLIGLLIANDLLGNDAEGSQKRVDDSNRQDSAPDDSASLDLTLHDYNLLLASYSHVLYTIAKTTVFGCDESPKDTWYRFP